MVLIGSGYELIGATVAGPPPLGRLYLRLAQDTTVFYGLNGAGKTRILRGIVGALGGYSGAGSGALHVRITDSLSGHPFVDALRDALAGEVVRLRSGLHERPEGITSPADATVPALMIDLLEASLEASGEDVARWSTLARDIAARGRLLLRPIGTPQRPEWSVFVAAERIPGSTVDVACAAQEQLERSLGDGAEPPAPRDLAGADTGFPRAFSAVLGEVLAVNRRAAHALGTDSVIRPSWLSWPLLGAGTTSASPAVVVGGDVVVGGPVADHDRRMHEVLFGDGTSADHLVTPTAAGDVAVDPAAIERAADLEREGNDALAALFGDALSVRFRWRSPDDWIRGDLPTWEAQDVSGTWVGIDELSTAQSRWAGAAIHFALRRHDPGTPLVLVADEPEAGLHRRAEMQVASGLVRLGRHSGSSIIAATHSPAFLGQPDTTVVRVFRDDRGRTGTRMCGAGSRAELEDQLAEYGLTGPDLFQLTRVFMIVEGEHDAIVAESLIGDQLAGARAHVLRLRGAKRSASLLEASMLFDFSDAPILLVLDNLAHEIVSPIWEEAMQLAEAGSRRRALSALRRLTHLDGGEPRWLLDLGSRAIEQHQLGRIDVFGTREVDIVCFLPPDGFVPDATSWDPLVEDWRAARRDGDRRDLKRWLERERRARFSIDRVRRVARETADSGRPVPADLTALAQRVATLSVAQSVLGSGPAPVGLTADRGSRAGRRPRVGQVSPAGSPTDPSGGESRS